MSRKNQDNKNRFRGKTIAFRVSEVENQQLEKLVELSGLTKQDYIIQCVLNHSVNVYGNPRVFAKLKAYFEDILKQLQEIKSVDEMSDEQAELLSTALKLYAELSSEHINTEKI